MNGRKTLLSEKKDHLMLDAIEAKGIDVGYANHLIINNLNISVPRHKITTIIGPNGCGKSTLIKTIARILKAKQGAVYLDGKAIHHMDTREVAKRMAILPQTAQAPGGLTVFELVSYGRFPHRKAMGALTSEDYDYIYWAIEVTGLNDLKDRATQRPFGWPETTCMDCNGTSSRDGYTSVG